MKHTLIILTFITATIQTFAQSPRIKLNQITKDSVAGSVLISSPTDSGMVYSRDFYISYGADTFLILGADTIALKSDLVAEIGDSLTNYVSRTELSDSTTNIRTDIPLIVSDSLTNYVSIAGTETITGAKTFTSALTQSGGDVNFDSGTLFVDESDNRVGIGTSSPNVAFQVNPDSLFAVDDVNDRIYINGTLSRDLFPTIRGVVEVNGSQQSVAFRYNGGFINETDDFGSLSKSTSATNKRIQYIYFDRNNVQIGKFGVDLANTDDDDFQIVAGSGLTPQFHLEADGNVGIGTTGPSYKLDVNGNVRADTYYYDVTSTLQSSSDSRLKQNITNMDTVLDKLKELELVKYEWNDNMYKKLEGRTSQSKLGGTFEGMIAQQVESLFPQYVGEDADGYKTLSYVSFVIPLLKGFQEQQAIIEQQATEIETLKSQIQLILTEIEQIKNN